MYFGLCLILCPLKSKNNIWTLKYLVDGQMKSSGGRLYERIRNLQWTMQCRPKEMVFQTEKADLFEIFIK